MPVNPQLENGHIDIANEIAEALAGYRLSGEEWQVLWVIIRKTWGWHKKEDTISLSQFCLLTKLLKPAINRSLKKLLTKRLITFNKSVNAALPNTYGFNKHYDQWLPLTKRLRDVNKSVNPTINQIVTHKRKGTTKEKDTTAEVPYQEIVDMYHKHCPSMPKVTVITQGRREKMRARWSELKSIERFEELFKKAGASSFLNGQDGKWKCNFDWLINSEKNMTKVFEGLYDNRDQSAPVQSKYKRIE